MINESTISSAHCLSCEEVLAELQSDLTNGLTNQEGEIRLNRYGFNKIPTQRQSTALEKLWAQINSVLIYILVVGSIVSFVFDHHIDGYVIIGVVVINVSLGYFMENKAENATAVLKSMMSPVAQVLREGDRRAIDSLSLTLGDVFYLQGGDIVPADGRVMRSSELTVLESPLTGESHPIIKNTNSSRDSRVPLAERKCMVFSGTQVLKGTGVCVVVGTGANCEIGKISGLLTDIEDVKTPLIVQLETFGMILSIVIVCLALGAFGIAYARGYPVADGLALAIGIAVAAIPEGLPSCITITFAIGVRYMAARHAIVKSLPAVETLGSVNVICSDKTGTLTINKMTVKEVVTAERAYKLSDAGKIEQQDGLDCSASVAAEIILYSHMLPGVMCNDGAILTKDTPLESLTPSKPPRAKYGRKNSESMQFVEDGVMKLLSSDCGDNFHDISPHEHHQIELLDVYREGEHDETVVGIDAPPSPPSIPTAATSADINGDFEIEGDPTETCMLTLAVSLAHSALKVKTMRKANDRLSEIPFDSSTKYMASMHFFDAKSINDLINFTSASAAMQKQRPDGILADTRDLLGDVKPNEEGKFKVIFVKGSPEKIVSFCELPPSYDSNNINMSDRPAPLSVFTRYWLDHANLTATRGMRVLGLAFKVVPADFEFHGHLPPHCGFTMTALVGIMDPPRPDAIVAIELARRAGITVKMITGDHPVTALAIGKMLGLNVHRRHDTSAEISNNDVECGGSDNNIGDGRAVTGGELDEYIIRSMAEFDQCVAEFDIFARTTPEHKIRIVQSLQRQGFVCSMTGDGVNDAPALKAANIGVAMGITGTEVAKDAAVVILTDDNFATIVDAIRVGRCTYNNLVKIITFVLPSNGGQAFSIVGALIIDVAVPITALQILWVNMITSVTLGLVLAFDEPDDAILTEKPRRKGKRLFGRFLTWRLFYGTVMFTAVVIGIYRWELHRISDPEELRTISVNCLSVAQMGYVFNCRSLRCNSSLREMFTGNMIVYLGLLAVVIFQVLFTYAPPFQYVFGTRPIDGRSWGKILLLAVCVFLFVELEKFVSTLRFKWRKNHPTPATGRGRSGSRYVMTAGMH